MDWVNHVPPELRAFALGREQALVRGGAKNFLDIIMSSDEAPDNKVLKAIGTAVDGVAWLFMSAQCGVLAVITKLSYSYASPCVLTDAGRRFIFYLLTSCPTLARVRVAPDILTPDCRDIRDFFARSRTIVCIKFYKSVEPVQMRFYVADLLVTNEVLRRVTNVVPLGWGEGMTRSTEDRNNACARKVEICRCNWVPIISMQTCISARRADVARNADHDFNRAWMQLRLFQNAHGTRARLTAAVFALERIAERNGVPLPIAAAILKFAFGGQSTGAHLLMADLGRVVAAAPPKKRHDRIGVDEDDADDDAAAAKRPRTE